MLRLGGIRFRTHLESLGAELLCGVGGFPCGSENTLGIQGFSRSLRWHSAELVADPGRQSQLGTALSALVGRDLGAAEPAGSLLFGGFSIRGEANQETARLE